MSLPDNPSTCQDLELHIEALVDLELEPARIASLEEHLKTCPDCAKQFRLATEIRRELRELPEVDTPSHVLETVFRHAKGGERRRWSWSSLWQLPRPAWIALGAAAASLLATLILLPTQSPPSPESSMEVIRATQEARLALAYLEKVTQRTARSLHDDVVQKRVVEPAARGLARSLKAPESKTPTIGPVSGHRSHGDTIRSS